MTVSEAPDRYGRIKMVDMSGIFALAGPFLNARACALLGAPLHLPDIPKCQPR